MIRMTFPALKIPVRALGLKQFRKDANGPNCEKAMACLVNYDIKGFQAAVKKAVAAGENINKITSNGETFFTFGVKIHNLHVINMLVAAAGPGMVDFNAPNVYGETFKVTIEEDKQENLPADKKEVEQNDVEVQIEEEQEVVVADKELVIEVLPEEVRQEIAQEIQIEEVEQKSESFIVALFNKLTAVNDQPPVFHDGTEDAISVVEEILPTSGQVDMVGDQGENISEYQVEKSYEKSLMFGSNF